MLLVQAGIPGPLTLSGTNSWVVGREPACVVDPGSGACRSTSTGSSRRCRPVGGSAALAVTHNHGDHAEAVSALRERLRAPVAAARGAVDVVLARKNQAFRAAAGDRDAGARHGSPCLRARASVLHRRRGAGGGKRCSSRPCPARSPATSRPSSACASSTSPSCARGTGPRPGTPPPSCSRSSETAATTSAGSSTRSTPARAR